MDTLPTTNRMRNGRALLADHILGTRRDIRRHRAATANSGYGKAWNDALLFAAESHIRDLRALAAEFSGR